MAAKVYPNVATPSLGQSAAAADDEPVTLTVWRKSLLFNCKGFTVFDARGNLVYRVDTYAYASDSRAEVVLMDAAGRPRAHRPPPEAHRPRIRPVPRVPRRGRRVACRRSAPSSGRRRTTCAGRALLHRRRREILRRRLRGGRVVPATVLHGVRRAAAVRWRRCGPRRRWDPTCSGWWCSRGWKCRWPWASCWRWTRCSASRPSSGAGPFLVSHS
ncbi:hypothetical protein PR202_gb01599 [Eleusine coracana subsp. coracana]|uniref:Uncharacterized protein n=1 Tax=Eleusine coracana subsp. coracana TaxID=191504 RepID=A0AAV5DUU1_ELECO|nr:hypothetical protein PR202_gb01599 [Eleusine coracana subsp. coracana]